jgi:hypothetical protein
VVDAVGDDKGSDVLRQRTAGNQGTFYVPAEDGRRRRPPAGPALKL